MFNLKEFNLEAKLENKCNSTCFQHKKRQKWKENLMLCWMRLLINIYDKI